MGTNCAAIFVRAPQAAVMKAIDAEYRRRGAKAGPAAHRADLAPLHVGNAQTKKTDLGVAVSREVGGWVTVIDSDRYDADASLARALARRLKCTVFWQFTGDVSMSHLLLRFGPRRWWSEVPAHFAVKYYDELPSEPAGDWALLSFTGVPVSSYETNPEELPVVKLRCPACGERQTWQCGVENEVTSDVANAQPETTTVTHEVPCEECREPLTVVLGVEHGVVVSARQSKSKRRKPKANQPRVAVWLDSSGSADPPYNHVLVSLDPKRALDELAADARNLGLGLVRGLLDDRGAFGVVNEVELVRYWKRDELLAVPEAERLALLEREAASPRGP